MYDINTKNVKKGKSFYFIFLAVGTIFLVVMVGILVSTNTKLKSLDSTILSSRVTINSHINDEGTTMYSPIYYYVIDGKEYACSSNLSSSSYPSTTNKTVYYDSKNPSNCMTEYSKSSNKILVIFLALPTIFIAVAVVNMQKISKRVKLINELNKSGKLIKNLPYHLENTGMSVNGVQIQKPVVEYTLPSGSEITLYGDPRHDRKMTDADGMVDLVIDENNPDNYFIDFEINRLTGNLPSDYFNNNSNNSMSYNNVNYQNNNQGQNNSYNLNNNYNFNQSPNINSSGQFVSQTNSNQEINQEINNNIR